MPWLQYNIIHMLLWFIWFMCRNFAVHSPTHGWRNLEGSKLSEPQLSINDNGLVTGPVQEFWWLEKQVKTYKLTSVGVMYAVCFYPTWRITYWYLISCDIMWYHLISLESMLFPSKSVQDPQDCVGSTATSTSLTIQPDAAEMCADSTSSMWKTQVWEGSQSIFGPRLLHSHLGKSWIILHGNSWFKLVKLFNTIHVGKLSPGAKAVNLLDAFVAAWSFLWSLRLWHSVGSNGKDVRRKGLCFEMRRTDDQFEKQMEKRTGLIKSERIWLWFILMDLFLSIWRHFSPICPKSPPQGPGTNFRCKPVQESHEIS